ncbi:MAG: hypothetical protein Q4C49_00360 [Bacillota bacterium]|nr:hypothetical protein [Bacillota bacterium]
MATINKIKVQNQVYDIKCTAEGHIYTASVDSLAEGTDGDLCTLNQASGLRSHAEGCHGTASGNYGSHAEGYETQASGEYGAHAEGYGTQASGNGSHSSGYCTLANHIIASGIGAHASGYAETDAYIKSDGSGSHAQGYAVGSYTLQASGEGAHADGIALSNNALAFGLGSHQEGVDTTAQGIGTHAECRNGVACGTGSHVEGIQDGITWTALSTRLKASTITEDAGSGKLTINCTKPSGASAPAIGNKFIRMTVDGVNYYTYCEGISDPGLSGTTFNLTTTATAGGFPSSVNNGTFAYANKIYGAFGIASHAEGYHTGTIGLGSHASGAECIAKKDCSHAMGR